MRPLGTYLTLGMASLLLALSCSAKKPDQSKASAKADSSLELRVDTATFASTPDDETYYLPGTRQYITIMEQDTTRTQLPVQPRLGLPELAYYNALTLYQEKELPPSNTLALSGENNPVMQKFHRDLLSHNETEIFLDYLCANPPSRVKPGTAVNPIPVESLSTPATLQRQFGKTVPTEQRPIDRSSFQLSLTYLTTFEGRLEEVIQRANTFQNTTYKKWKAEFDKKGEADNDYEGFYHALIKREDGKYSLVTYGISASGKYADGTTAKF